MNQQTTKVPTVLGIVSIILAGLAILFHLAIGLLAVIGAGLIAEAFPGVDAGAGVAVVLIVLFLTLAMDALLLVGGIGLVKYKRWGRILSLVWAGIELALLLVNLILVTIALAAGAGIGAAIQLVICLILMIYPVVLLVMLNSKQVIAALNGQTAAGGVPARPSSPLGTPYPSTVPAGPERGGAAMPYGTPPRAGAPAGPGAGPTTVYASPAAAGRYGAASHGGGDARDTQVIRPPDAKVSLQQMGGRENGRNEQLKFRDPFGQPVTNDIGRESDCRIVITGDPSVSHHHCRLGEDENGNLYVCDLDSREGTFAICGRMRPQRVRGKMYIRDGDILLVGGVMFTVRVAKAPKVEDLWYR